MWYWITDLIIPLFTMGFGTLTKRRPPNYGRSILRWSRRAMTSQKTWDYASRQLGEFWFKIGIVLVVWVLLHRAFSTLNPAYVSAINIASGLACLAAGLPVVERALRNEFDKDGNEAVGHEHADN